MNRLHLMFHGRVQGVGFRAYIRHQARDLGLNGWVRNLADGTVEVAAEGDPADLSRLRALADTLPGWARVTEVVEEWSEGPPRFKSFEISR